MFIRSRQRLFNLELFGYSNKASRAWLGSTEQAEPGTRKIRTARKIRVARICFERLEKFG